jgi:hypothetical protein
MRLTWKDGVATVLVAATVALYGAHLAWGSIGPSWVGIQDAAGMATVGLGVGVALIYLGGWITDPATGVLRYLALGLQLVSLALGVLALLGEDLLSTTAWECVLAAFIGGIVLSWALGVGRHAGLLHALERPPTGVKPA